MKIDPLRWLIELLFGLEATIRLARVRLNSIRARRALRRLDRRMKNLSAAALDANVSSTRFSCALRNLGAALEQAGPASLDSANFSSAAYARNRETKR